MRAQTEDGVKVKRWKIWTIFCIVEKRLYLCRWEHWNAENSLLRYLSLSVEWKPEDLWIGVYVDTQNTSYDRRYYLCMIPCLPLRVHFKSYLSGGLS